MRGSSWGLSRGLHRGKSPLELYFGGWQETRVASSDGLKLCLGGIKVRGQLSAQGEGAAGEAGEEPC